MPRRIVIAGAVVGLLAAFLPPAVFVPIGGSLTYYAANHFYGGTAMVLCVLAAGAALFRLTWMGIVSGVIIGGMLFAFEQTVATLVANAHSIPDDIGQFHGLANLKLDRIHLEWGFSLLIAAAAGMFAGGVLSVRVPKAG